MPWFLYGVKFKGPEGVKRRQDLQTRYNTKDPVSGAWTQWPEFAREVLSSSEIQEVEFRDQQHFA